MIEPMNRSELLESLYDLVAEVELGNHFERGNKEHADLLKQRVDPHFNNGCEVFGYREKGAEGPVGYVMTVVSRGMVANDCEIMEIGVEKESRGKGIGSELLAFVEAHHGKDRLDRIVVRTYAADFEVIHFYGKNGYAPIAVIPGTNGPEDEGTIVMRKLIAKKKA